MYRWCTGVRKKLFDQPAAHMPLWLVFETMPPGHAVGLGQWNALLMFSVSIMPQVNFHEAGLDLFAILGTRLSKAHVVCMDPC